MTAQATRDALAEMDGWEVLEFTREPAHKFWWHEATATRREIEDHPHPPTLDGADAAVPEGWTWYRRHIENEEGLSVLCWMAFHKDTYDGSEAVIVPDTGDKIADLYALGLACRRAMENKA